MIIIPNRIRFDDVITSSSDPKLHGKEVQKFLKNVNWCKSINVPLTPAILCQDIEQFPEGIKALQELIKEEIVYPDLHGWDHGPYGNKNQKEIEEHLEKSKKWFQKNFGVEAIRWVTPHGADSPEIQAAAMKYNLVVETTNYPVIDQKVLDKQLRQSKNLNVIKDRIVMVHWWERGLRLYRIAKIIEYQDINIAIHKTKNELTKKEHRICWNGW